MSLKRIRTRVGAAICSLVLLALGLVVGLNTNQASATTSAAAVNSGGVVMLAPCRAADSRDGTPLSTFHAFQTQDLYLANSCGVPYFPAAAGVILSITVVPAPGSTAGGGYLTLYPSFGARPTVSQVSYNSSIVSTEVTVRMAFSSIAIYNGSAGGADVIVDVAGYIVA